MSVRRRSPTNQSLGGLPYQKYSRLDTIHVSSLTTVRRYVFMVITVLEAQVAPEKAILLEATYKQAIQHLETGIVQTFLIRSAKEPGSWQIVTLWQSREALEAMRASGETPRGVLIFRAVEAEPTLSVFGVVAHA